MLVQVAVEFVDLSSPIEALAVAAKAAVGKELSSKMLEIEFNGFG